MQDYISMAAKNNVQLKDSGSCQFCGSNTQRGVHECIELFNLSLNFPNHAGSASGNYRFICVDAHTLQHPELHGRWNNHFHLLRQRLIFHHSVLWSYKLSPILSQFLGEYKENHPNQILKPPEPLSRGKITTSDLSALSIPSLESRNLIEKWGREVHRAWSAYHELIEQLSVDFLAQYQSGISFSESE